MRVLPIQEVYTRKFERQKRIRGLEYHACGHCVHIGRISPGCQHCFARDDFYRNYYAGTKCNLDCTYCTSDKDLTEVSEEDAEQVRLGIAEQAAAPGYSPSAYSFTGGGEPLIHIDYIEKCIGWLRESTRSLDRKPWYYLYTNGLLADEDMLLRLKDLGFDEIRFHLGASNFARKVYANVERAVEHFKAVTVETPSWEGHRAKLFEMLPILDSLGVKHLNLGEIEILEHNIEAISRALPQAEVYRSHEMHLYDGGLVYDLMEAALEGRYSFSVLDCSCFVKSFQRGQSKWIGPEDIEGLFAEY